MTNAYPTFTTDPHTKAQIITAVWTRCSSPPFYLDIILICPFGGLCCGVVIIATRGWTAVVGWSLRHVLH
jgi:hypothetical protein